ncbi:hypothetical protein N8D56_03215 [Devosia sp. A8/3-2]|nr:hypothetical protein N8D56_03215 [Devosia sp. A8/3-2]
MPKLYREGWRGPMWMTEPTSGLLEYLLPDSAGIQESEAERETKSAAAVATSRPPCSTPWPTPKRRCAIAKPAITANGSIPAPGYAPAIGMPATLSARPPSRLRWPMAMASRCG